MPLGGIWVLHAGEAAWGYARARLASKRYAPVGHLAAEAGAGVAGHRRMKPLKAVCHVGTARHFADAVGYRGTW